MSVPAPSDGAVAKFVTFTGASVEEADQFIAMADGSLERGVALFLELHGPTGGGGGGGARALYVDEGEIEPPLEPLSSSEFRKAMAAGNVEGARRFMGGASAGRAFELLRTVPATGIFRAAGLGELSVAAAHAVAVGGGGSGASLALSLERGSAASSSRSLDDARSLSRQLDSPTLKQQLADVPGSGRRKSSGAAHTQAAADAVALQVVLQEAAARYLPWTCQVCTALSESFPSSCEVCDAANPAYDAAMRSDAPPRSAAATPNATPPLNATSSAE